MPDLRQTRKKIQTALAVMLGVDLVAAVILFSPLVGSTESRRQQLNDAWIQLQVKTRQVQPLENLPKKVVTAHQQVIDFYAKRFPSQDSQIATEFGKLAVTEGVTLEQAKYDVKTVREKENIPGGLQPYAIEADLAGSYVSLARFINALERDQMFFIINSVTLASEQQGPIKLQMKVETYLKAGTR
jgi:Tfp pilus assembly protein PilO